jgi:hypothetical protein
MFRRRLVVVLALCALILGAALGHTGERTPPVDTMQAVLAVGTAEPR